MSTAYRSIYSGQEIDEAIAAMKASNGLLISNDFLGGINKAASAELAKTLDGRLDNIENPVALRDLLAQVPDSNIFTNSLKAKVDSFKPNFKGVFLTKADRDAKISTEYASYIGTEVCIVLDNGTGTAELELWDPVSIVWRRIKLYGVGEFDPVTTSSLTPVQLFKFDTSIYNTMKVMVSVSNTTKTQRQVQEIIVAVIGTDTYISIYGDVGNAQLFTASTTITSGVASLSITPSIAGVQITAKQIALL